MIPVQSQLDEHPEEQQMSHEMPEPHEATEAFDSVQSLAQDQEVGVPPKRTDIIINVTTNTQNVNIVIFMTPY